VSQWIHTKTNDRGTDDVDLSLRPSLFHCMSLSIDISMLSYVWYDYIRHKVT
jgi:ABC-type transport system involved in Fe-S cluster assembly fused permease/ATPase subunit